MGSTFGTMSFIMKPTKSRLTSRARPRKKELRIRQPCPDPIAIKFAFEMLFGGSKVSNNVFSTREPIWVRRELLDMECGQVAEECFSYAELLLSELAQERNWEL